MISNELRIWNLIAYNGINCTVEVINGEVDEVYILGDDFYYGINIGEIEPIPLTEEWLLKFGFIKSLDEYGGYLKELPNGNKYRIKNNTYSTQHFEVKFEYVHQLQNFHFSITNEELKIN